MQPPEKNISAEEEIKELLESEKGNKKELDEKKADLEKKKKELDELEKQKEKEIASTRIRIEQKMEELATDERRNFEELEELRKKRAAQAVSLEEEIGKEEGGEKKPEQEQAQRGYGDAIQEILHGKPTFYDMTNYNVVNQLEQIAARASSRPLNEAEKTFVEMVSYHASQLQKDDFYKNKNGANYLRKEMAEIDFINKLSKKRDEEERDYNP